MALRLRTITHASQLGISVGEVNVDLQKLVQFSRTVSQQLTAGVAYLLKKNGVRVIDGTARLRGKANHGRGCPREARDYRADHVIGNRRPTTRIAGIAPDGEHIWTYFEALRLSFTQVALNHRFRGDWRRVRQPL